MIYAKHFKTLFDDLPRESMEYGPKVHPFYESRNPEGPILGEIRLMKHAPCGCPSPLVVLADAGTHPLLRYPLEEPAPVKTGAGTHPPHAPPAIPIQPTLPVGAVPEPPAQTDQPVRRPPPPSTPRSGNPCGCPPPLVVLADGDLCITVIPAPEPESKGGNLGLNLMSILPNMVSHQ